MNRSAYIPSLHHGITKTFGMLCYAETEAFEKELHSEIEQIVIRDELPSAWTYPEIQPHLIREVLRRTGHTA